MKNRVDMTCFKKHRHYRFWVCTLSVLAAACGGDDKTSDELDPQTGNDAKANLTLSVATLNFGDVRCGGKGAEQRFVVSNTGTESATWKVELAKKDASPFQLDTTQGSLAPRTSLVVRVTPRAIPEIASTQLNAYGDTVVLSSDAPTSNNTTIELLQTASGPQVELSQTTIDFGKVAQSQITSGLVLRNTGNASILITGEISSSAFSAIVPNQVLEPGKTLPVTVNFSPNTTGPLTSQLKLVGTGACGSLPKVVTLKGEGTASNIAINKADLFFGDTGYVDCGTTSAPQTVTLTNNGDVESFFSTALESNVANFYTVSPSTGSIPAGGSVELSVATKAIPATSAVTADMYGGKLTITTTGLGDTPYEVNLHQTARGAILTRSVASVNVGSPALSTTSTQTISVTNTGNASATLEHTPGDAAFTVSTVAVAAASTQQLTINFTPSAVQGYSDVAIPAISGTTYCGPALSSLTLSGSGVASSLQLQSPTTLNYGFVACNTTAPSQKVTFKNNGPATTFTATFGKGSAANFTVTPSSGSLTAGQTLSLTVAPHKVPATAPITANQFGDLITVTTADGRALNVTLQETALGAMLEYRNSLYATAVNSATFSSTSVASGSATQTFSVFNVGNLNITNVQLISSNTADYTLSPSTLSSVTAGTGELFSLTFDPATTGTRTTNVTLGTGTTPICRANPTLSVSGTAAP